jgi:hypothetical protein
MTNAMQGLGTGNRAGKPAERKQEIMTPEYIREAVLRTWPGGIALGPAGNEASIMGCARQYLLSRGRRRPQATVGALQLHQPAVQVPEEVAGQRRAGTEGANLVGAEPHRPQVVPKRGATSSTRT